MMIAIDLLMIQTSYAKFQFFATDECLVISRWTTLQHWQEWNRTSRRMEIDNGMEKLLGAETEYKFYGVGLW